MPPATPGPLMRFLRAVFWEDWLLKIVCFILAMLSYFYIDGELSDEREFTVDVPRSEVRLPEGLEVAPDSVFPPVRVKIRGPRRRLQYIDGANIRIDVQSALPKPAAGDNPVALRAEQVRVDGVPNIDVVRVEHDAFNLRLLGVTRRMLPVKLRRQGNPPPGFRLVNAIIEPREVLITSVADISQAESVWTEPIDISGRSENFQLQGVPIARTLSLGDRDVEIRCHETVTVTLQIHREEITRMLENVPLRALAPAGAAMFAEPAAVHVAVTGAPEEVAALRPVDLTLYVDWPADWDLQQPAGHAFAPVNVQVKAVAPGRMTVRGEKDLALPVVKVRGVLTGAPK